MSDTVTRSTVVLQQLAVDAVQTSLNAEEDSSLAYVDQSLRILGRTVESFGQRLQQEFFSQRVFNTEQFQDSKQKTKGLFTELDSRLRQRHTKLDERLKQAHTKFDSRLKQINQRFDRVETDIEKQFKDLDYKIDKRLAEFCITIREQMYQVQNASLNFMKVRGYEEILPVGPFDTDGKVITPPCFPRTINRFWALKDLPKS